MSLAGGPAAGSGEQAVVGALVGRRATIDQGRAPGDERRRARAERGGPSDDRRAAYSFQPRSWKASSMRSTVVPTIIESRAAALLM